MQKKFLGVLVAAAACLAVATAQAAVVTQTMQFSIPSTTTSTNALVPASTFQDFEPALGTLNSFSLSLTGTGSATASGPNHLILVLALDEGSQRSLSLAGFGQLFFFGAGANSLNFSASGVDTSDVDFVSAPGTFTLGFLFATGPDSATFSSGPLTETLTYNFTPAVAGVPEPAPLALLGIGFAGLAAGRRRRKT